MLTVLDDRSGDQVVLGGRPGAVVRVGVALPTAQLGPGELRAVLVADVLRRVLEELHGQQAMMTIAAPGITIPALRQQLTPLWIPEPGAVAGSIGEVRSVAGGPPHVVVAAPGAEAGADVPRLSVGSVGESLPEDAEEARLVLLSQHYSRPLTVGEAERDEAAATLSRWRDSVAGWAANPSARMPEGAVGRAYAACDTHLDTPAVLDLFREVEQDTTVSPGAKFEFFVHFDRILAVNLAAHLGKG